MGKKKSKNEGFTLVEVLAVVVLIAVVFTFAYRTYTYIINNSKYKAVAISMDNIMSAAELYSKENKDVSSWWGYVDETNDIRFYCVSIQDLINDGYFGKNKNIVSDNGINNNSLIRVVKDMNNMTIIKTEVSYEEDVNKCTNKLKDDIAADIGINESEVYSITYDFNDGTGRIVVETRSKKLPNYSLITPNSSAFTFDGWYSNRYGGTKIGDAGESIHLEYDLKLFGHWNAKPDIKYVKIQYNVNGGSLASPHGNVSIDSSTSLVKLNGTNVIHMLADKENLSVDGLLSPTNDKLLNLRKAGHTIVSKKEWCTKSDGTGKCYNQKTQYNASDFCSSLVNDCTVTLYANWKKNKINIVYNVDGGKLVTGNYNTIYTLGSDSTVYKNGQKMFSSFDYGSSLDSSGLLNWNSSSHLNVAKAGYHIDSSSVWCTEKNGGGTCFDQTTAYAVSRFCDASNGDCTRTLYAYWIMNKVKIQIDANGGKLAAKHGAAYALSGSLVTVNGSNIIHSINYGGTLGSDGLVNWNNKDYLNLEKVGYSIDANSAYCTKADGTGKCYDQTVTYKASDFCDAVSNDCTVKLYAHWRKTKVLIQIDVNGGALVDPHGAAYGQKGSLVTVNGSTIIHSLTYGSTFGESGLANWNNKDYLNLGRTGYTINGSSAYCKNASGALPCYDHAYAYKASDFCDASAADCTVTLYAHWVGSKYNVTYRGLGGFVRLDANSTNLLANYSGTYNKGTGYLDSPTHWWDLSGNRRWGNLNGTIKWGEDHLIFNGSNTHVDLKEINSPKQTIIVTFSTSSPSTGQYLLGNWEAAGGGLYLSGGKIRGEYYIDSLKDYARVVSTESVVADKIYTAAVTYDGSYVRLYVNGVASGTPYKASGNIKSTTTHMMMGCNPSGDTCTSGYLKGKIYEAAIIAAALPAARVKASSFMEVTYAGKYSGLPTPTKNGYDFVGWFTAKKGGTQITEDSVVSTPNDHVLYARWTPYISNGNYAIVPNSSQGFAFDVNDANITNGTSVQLYTKGSGIAAVKAQTWKVINIGDGGIRIVNKHSIKDLDLKGNNVANGTDIQIYGWNGSTAQRWYPIRVSKDVFTLRVGTNLGYVTDIAAGKFADHQNIQLYESNSTAAQKFKFVPAPDNYYKAYNIRYNSNGGTGTMDLQPSTWGDNVTLNPNEFTRTYFTFQGWTLTSAGTGVLYADGGTYSGFTHNGGTVDLYAKWKDTTNPTCTVTKSHTGYTDGVNTTVRCSDQGLGCDSGKNPTGDTGLKSGKSYVVYDREGNSGSCSVSVTSTNQTRNRSKSCNHGTKTVCVGGYVSKSFTLTCELSEYDAHSYSDFSNHYKCGNCYCGYKSVWDDCKSTKTVTDYDTCVSYSYGSWSNWTTNSCTESSSRDCDYRTLYS